jgi:NAD-dependent deacetylase
MRVVVLTGAGISAESGIPTFRGPDGLWEGHRVDDVATPEGFARDPDTVQRFYDQRRRTLARVEPNAAHRALARLEALLGDDVLIVTQNVDDLHERAGSRQVVHMHGELRRALCLACGERHPWNEDLAWTAPAAPPRCPVCGVAALRPDVVWFGEVPYDLDRIEAAVFACYVFAAVGTSGEVYPAAGFAALAAAVGAHTVELNLDPTRAVTAAGVPAFAEVREGPASVIVPAWVEALVGGEAAPQAP